MKYHSMPGKVLENLKRPGWFLNSQNSLLNQENSKFIFLLLHWDEMFTIGLGVAVFVEVSLLLL